MTKTSWMHQLVIAGIAAALYFTSLGATRLWDEDEAFFATAAAEMHRHDDWIVPTFNEELFAHKPPLMYWMMRLGFTAFGVNELGARFGSAVFALLTALLVYQVGRILFSPRVGLWSGLAFATSLMWSVVARAATADCYLAFFITASLLVYVREVFGSGLIHGAETSKVVAAGSVDAVLQRWLPQRWSVTFSMYALMAMAVLVKGPIGVLLPGATIGLFVLLQMPWNADLNASLLRRVMARLRPILGRPLAMTFWRMRPFTAILAVLLIAGPWFALVGWKTDGAFLQEFFGVHNFGRFLKPMENHRGPLVYYIPVILVGLFPWSIFAIPTISHALRNAAAGSETARFQFMACWGAVMIGFFSIASTKLPNYVLPAYPALAVLVAAWLVAWRDREEQTSPRWMAIAFGSLAVIGMLIAAGLFALGTLRLGGDSLAVKMGINAVLAPELARIAWIGMPLIAGGVACLIMLHYGNRGQVLRATAMTGVLFTGCVLIYGAQRFNRFQTSHALIESIRRESVGPAKIGAFRHFPPSLVFYAGQHVERLRDAKSARRFLESSGTPFVVTTEAGRNQLAAAGVTSLANIDERPRFPRAGSVLAVGPAGQATAAAAADTLHR